MSAETIERLSPREFQVAGLLSRGLSTKEIAAELNPPVSFETAKGYVASLLHKLSVPNRAAAVALYVEYMTRMGEPEIGDSKRVPG